MFEFFSGHRQAVGIAGGIATLLVIVSITAGIAIRRRPAPTPETTVRTTITRDDFIIPDEVDRWIEHPYFLYREPREAWSDAEVSEFMIDPDLISREVLEQINTEELRRLVESMP